MKDFIARKIANGSLKPGDRVPSEQDLVAEFGMARMTVNRALRELAEQGKIVRVAGVGSFVARGQAAGRRCCASPILPTRYAPAGHDHRCQLLSLARVAATMDVANALALHTGAVGVRLDLRPF